MFIGLTNQFRRHDIRHNGIQHNDIQHYDFQLICDIQDNNN
jgi:hypothetical protein